MREKRFYLDQIVEIVAPSSPGRKPAYVGKLGLVVGIKVSPPPVVYSVKVKNHSREIKCRAFQLSEFNEA